MERYILAIDQGTTGSRALVVGPDGAVKASSYREHTQIYPKPGWVEHDAEEIWANVVEVMHGALARANATGADVAAIGITNQRETLVMWDKATGKPVHNAIVWQCRRTAEAVDCLVAEGMEPRVQDMTGLVLDPYFSATKIRWVLDNVPEARELSAKGSLAFGTIDTWLVWKLSGGKAHITDVSNASRTLLLNIHTLAWDDELLATFGIPAGLLPEVKDSSGELAYTEAQTFGRPIPIAGIAGDQQAATFGQACFHPGQAKNTYGTGCFLLMNTGATPIPSTNRLLTTVGWKIGADVTYALEGSVFVAGAAISWLRDGLGIIADALECEELARSVPDTGGVYFVPALTGLGAPYWNPRARGAIVGLSRGTHRCHIVRAAVEAMAYQTQDLLGAMEADMGTCLTVLRVDGGASANDFLVQFQADLLGVPVERPASIETTGLGAAYLAGVGIGWWNQTQLEGIRRLDRVFVPRMDGKERSELLAGWREAVGRVLT